MFILLVSVNVKNVVKYIDLMTLYDEDIFDGYSYSDFKKLCKTTDFSLEKAIMENVIYVCDECDGDAEIVDIVDGGVYYE